LDTAVGLLKEGVYDYLVKNENTKDRIWNALQHVKEKIELTDEIERLREEVSTLFDCKPRLVLNGTSYENMEEVIGEIAKKRSALRKFVKKALSLQLRFRKG
jgi:two-component system response regulator AtoC